MSDRDILQVIGQRIREIRKAKGLSQEALAERSGFQTSYIGATERGERNLSIVNLHKIAESLAVDIGVLFDLDKNIFELGHTLALNELLKMLKDRQEDELATIIRMLNEVFAFYVPKSK
ncbi:helix-turn-helix domain-containing protein [Paenibacillus cymbidii]|uniref:helix-turn-helix domain-containing protein n=1 Tax=Paenibacillus cymbidii TaxID=1639034 RepID=UPI001081B008|nr:helix-turn-helix transcriptional regulator [Paenibacillus cymbidii]